MAIHDLWRIVRKRWLSIIVITVLGALLGFASNLANAKTYSTTAQNFVAIGGVSGDNAQALVFSGSNFALQRVKSYEKVVDSPAVLQPVIDSLGLDMTPQQLAGRVSASNPPQTVLLNITVTGTDPVEIAKIANGVAARYGEEIQRLETPEDAKKAPVKVSTIIPAQVPGSPVSPRNFVNIALGLLLGLGVGLAQAILREPRDTSQTSPDTLSEATGSVALEVVDLDPEANAQVPQLVVKWVRPSRG